LTSIICRNWSGVADSASVRADGVHQHHRGPDLGGDAVDDGLRDRRIGRVARHLADAVGQFTQPFGVAIDSCDGEPGADQLHRHRPAERAARTDHQRHSITHRRTPFISAVLVMVRQHRASVP
jgi:hypothetical protein